MDRHHIEALREIPVPDPIAAAEIDALRYFGRKSADALKLALDDEDFIALGQREWSTDLLKLGRFHGHDVPDHFLAAADFPWFTGSEVQMTKAFAHFLDSGHGARRLARIAAFLHALGAPVEGWPGELLWAEIKAEMPTACGRIDLVILAQNCDGPLGAVIEVKFEHHAGGNPFSVYQDAAKEMGLDSLNCIFAIVGKCQDNSIRNALSEKGTPWRFISWWRVLLDFQKQLPATSDDDEFRRFRKTVFMRAF